jgi:acetyl-CoA C-acetyltransferase
MQITEAYIIDAVRTPRGKGKKTGALHEVKPIDLLATVLRGLQHKTHFPNQAVEDIFIGCVTPIGEQGGNLGRALGLYAGLDYRTSGLQLNRFCASALTAINLAAAKIRAGWNEGLMIAGGVESMSRVPMGSDGGVLMFDPAVSGKVNHIPQGVSADLIATLEGLNREDLDIFALESYRKAAFAQANKLFDRSMVPVCDLNGLQILATDEPAERNTDLAQLAQLAPSFAAVGKKGFDMMALLKYPFLERIRHLHTAGNSSQIADGAGLVLLGSLDMCQEYGLAPRARVLIAATTSDEPTIMLTGTIPATELALKRAGLSAEDIDIWEVNEAFAASTLKFQKHFAIPSEKLNPLGGAIALGHPLGATGAMLVATLLDELERQDKTIGLVCLCTSGGMGVTTILERVR